MNIVERWQGPTSRKPRDAGHPKLETELYWAGDVGHPPSRTTSLVGFSESETAMIGQTIKNLQAAGYDTAAIEQVIKADMGNKLGMSLSTPPTGMALSGAAFESQSLLDSTMEEELGHLGQGLAEREFDRAMADQLENELRVKRKFPDPQEHQQ